VHCGASRRDGARGVCTQTLWPRVVVTSSPARTWETVAARAGGGPGFHVDDVSAMTFDDERTLRQMQRLREACCKLCGKKSATVQALNQHLEEKHARSMCMACVTTRKLFPAEHGIFTKDELLLHYEKGSPAVGDQARPPDCARRTPP
jgi:hypothetical protein